MIKLLLELSSHIIAVLAGLLAFRKMPVAYRIIFAVILAALANELVTAFLGSKQINGTWCNNIYLVLDCGLFLTAGYLLMRKKSTQFIFLAGFVMFATAWLYHIFNKGISAFAIQAYIIDSVLLIILYGILLYQEALHWKGPIWRSPILWLCLAIIIFYGCNIPYFSMLETVSRLSWDQKKFLHNFLVVINNLHYLLMTVMFLIIYFDKDPLKNEINRR